MVVLNFTLNEEGVAVLHDVLACILKFSDDVCLEAKKDKLTLTALNISKSAYVCFTFAPNRFFSRYNFEGNAQYRERFFCQLHIRSLLSVFRPRHSGDSGGSREGTIERCDVAIDDGPGKESRLIARVTSRNGLTASHSLVFEPKAPTHAKFDKTEATNHWTISSRTLRQLMDHFGPVELLDINTDDETRVVNFTCFTEKVQKRGANNNEAVLKKPLHTSIAVDMDEFNDVEVEDKLHVIISVKDFRAILQHAQIVGGELTTHYSNPGRPMKLSYSTDGVLSEFVLMTIGEKDAISQKHKNPRANSVAARAVRPELDSQSRRGSSVVNSNQRSQAQTPNAPNVSSAPKPATQFKPPPPPAASRQPQFEIRPQPMPPPATARSDSLFVAQDDDRQWEPLNPDEEEEEGDVDQLGWNSNHDPNPSALRINSYANANPEPGAAAPAAFDATGLEPTQRLSQVRQFGLFSS